MNLYRMFICDLRYLPCDFTELECGPMPNVMATLPSIDCALCSTRQSLADAHYYCRVPCSNAAKTWNPLKCAGVPQTRQLISALMGRTSPRGGDITV